jgi:23S rRNA (uracil1939-C5)-methyltransferase
MEQIELTLSGHAYLGSSFGRDDHGRVIFVPFTIPGECVQIEIVESHKRWARGKIKEVIEPSPHRVEPRCQHFQDCGGCHYQHMPYELQLEAKAEILRSQLGRIGGFSDPPLVETIPSPTVWNSRNHMQFSLDPAGRLGFRAANSERVVPIRECYLPDTGIGELWPTLNITPIPSLERVAFRIGDESEGMVVLYSSEDPNIELEIDVPASVVWIGDQGYTVLAGESSFQITILERKFQVSAGSFFQVHTELASSLVNLVLDSMKIGAGNTILDLFAGTGLFSAFLADAGARVIAVEQSPWATKDFETNLAEFDTVELYEASVETVLPSLHIHPDAVLVDPPRAGMGPAVIQGIIDLSPPKLVYVSCDPTTLARDGKALQDGGYNPRSITPIDLFPQTFHIETISLWEK